MASGGKLSQFTVDTYVRNVNLFLGWCRREGETGDVRAQPPKLPRRVLDVLSRDEIDRLEKTVRFERDKVIVRLLADTGIRANELIGVRQVDLVERRAGPIHEGRDRFIRVDRKGVSSPSAGAPSR